MNTEELQAGAIAPETPPEAGAESATATGDNLEQNNEGTPRTIEGAEGGAQEPAEGPGATKRINQLHYEKMEERRARLAVEQELQKLQQSQPQEQRPAVPPLPDPYDDNFDGLMQARDQAVTAAASFDARQEQAQTVQQQNERQQVAEQQQVLQQTVKTYAERAGKLNVSAQELQVAGQTVAAYGISGQLAQFILGDEQGPLITTYLAKNPAEIESLRSMDPMRAAVHIATNIRGKAGAAQNTPSAPPPADTLGGGGAPPAERGPKGAKFE